MVKDGAVHPMEREFVCSIWDISLKSLVTLIVARQEKSDDLASGDHDCPYKIS